MDSNVVIARASALMAGHGFALVKMEEFWQAHPGKASISVAVGTLFAFAGLVSAYGVLMIANKTHHGRPTNLEALSACLFIGMVGGFVVENMHV